MRMMVLQAVIIGGLPLPAAANELLIKYRGEADQCLQSVDERGGEALCRGLLFAVCQPVGGIEACMQAEAQFWEEQVVLQFEGAVEEMTRQDEAYPLAENRAEALAEAQVAWRAFQVAECEVMALTTGSDAYCYESTGFARALRLIDLQEPLQ